MNPFKAFVIDQDENRKVVAGMRTMPSAAVKPAVPSAMASKRSSPAGSGTTQPAGTRAYSAKPPWWATPMSKLVAMTLSPGWKRASALPTTAPHRSMPPTQGKRRMILPAPVAASASL